MSDRLIVATISGTGEYQELKEVTKIFKHEYV